jgi:thiol-disulfide isomerase/thioredoxin
MFWPGAGAASYPYNSDLEEEAVIQFLESALGEEAEATPVVEDSHNVEMLTMANYSEMTNGSTKPWFVMMGATWCGACSQMKPNFESASVSYADQANFGYVDLDTDVDLYWNNGGDGFIPYILWIGLDGNQQKVDVWSESDIGNWIES